MIAFSCACGEIHGTLRDIDARSGTGLVCFCTYCRAAEVFLDQPDPESDGVGQYQTTPDHVSFAKGGNRMYAFSFAQDGLIRWYAKCCKVPLFITPPDPKKAQVNVLVDRLAETGPLGPIRAMLFQPDGAGRRTHAGLRQLRIAQWRRAWRMRRTGAWKTSPFFGKSGAPISRVHVLSPIETTHLPLD